MNNKQCKTSTGAIVFAILGSQSVTHELHRSGQPIWLSIVVAAAVAGILVGIWTYLAGRRHTAKGLL